MHVRLIEQSNGHRSLMVSISEFCMAGVYAQQSGAWIAGVQCTERQIDHLLIVRSAGPYQDQLGIRKEGEGNGSECFA